MHILIAPNAFKNSLPADEVAEAIEKGLKQSALEFSSECFPIADGGDGTARLITKHCKGTFVTANAHDPIGRPIKASFGLIHNGATAVIDMATASGLSLLSSNELRPLSGSSFGTGELLKAALQQGVKRILIGVGGSATVDGGAGILEALGVKFFDHNGLKIAPSPQNLLDLFSIDVSGMDRGFSTCECVVLCDVDNPLLGTTGAAHIFGPQKGASASDVEKLERAMVNLNSVALKSLGRSMNIPHGGAAGGASAGLATFANARLVKGIDYFLTVTAFDRALAKADLLITGEGSIDLQTLSGKAPYGVATLAKNKNIPVIAVAGKTSDKDAHELHKYFQHIISVANRPVDLQTALRNTREDLIRTGIEIGNKLAAIGLTKFIEK
jgi:glycerate 2-kinase